MIGLLFKHIKGYKIYFQIDEFLDSKQRFHSMMGYREVLTDFATFTRKNALNAITEDDIQRYKQRLLRIKNRTGEVGQCLTKVRFFFRFWHVRKAVSIHPNLIV